jgi:hypothetical protein
MSELGMVTRFVSRLELALLRVLMDWVTYMAKPVPLSSTLSVHVINVIEAYSGHEGFDFMFECFSSKRWRIRFMQRQA